VERALLLLANVQQRRQDRRANRRQRRTADPGPRIGPNNRRRRMPVIVRVVFRLETIRTPAVFAEVRLVGHFPIADRRAAIPVMLHQILDQPLPFRVIVRLDDVLVNLGKQRLGLETDAHQRLGPGFKNRIDRTIERVEVIFPRLGQQVEVFLDEQANHLRPQRVNFGDAVVPHRLDGKPALAEGHPIDFQRPQAFAHRDGNRHVARLGQGPLGGGRQHDQQAGDSLHHAPPSSASSFAPGRAEVKPVLEN